MQHGNRRQCSLWCILDRYKDTGKIIYICAYIGMYKYLYECRPCFVTISGHHGGGGGNYHQPVTNTHVRTGIVIEG